MPILSHYVRNWDAISAMRVDHFIADSHHVAARITKYYRRDSTVIYPPVDFDAFECAPPTEIEDYYLMVGELVAYKRPELAIEAFNASGRRLIVIGGGQMFGTLLHLAGPNVTMLGPQSFDVLRHHYARCQALIFPGEEDFGIVPLEAMASGRPVIAYGKGGATETVKSCISGVFFYEQTIEAIEEAILLAEQIDFNPQTIRDEAAKFRIDRFESEIKAFIDRVLPSPVIQKLREKVIPPAIGSDDLPTLQADYQRQGLSPNLAMPGTETS
jgi:glycosyltransferase involved in cell wall biosynthesis